MTKKTAIVIGSTGVVGQELVKLLLNDPLYEEVISYSRSSVLTKLTNVPTDKLTEHLVEFADISKWQQNIHGDDLFICLGTTLKQAGSKEQQEIIDLNYPVSFATAAKNNGIETVSLVSSTGANAGSTSFYLRLKGQLEQSLLSLGFTQTVFVRPSVLVGNRPEFRLGEEFSKCLLNLLKWLPWIKKYRPIAGKQVAAAMLALVKEKSSKVVIKELDELFDYS